jgi:hypothetical protein
MRLTFDILKMIIPSLDLAMKLSVNQISAIIESQNQRVDESKRKRTVCVHWLNG